MTTPDFMPVLAAGAHDDPRQGACVMEYVSLLAGEPWSDSPSCTHPVLASMARAVNDRLRDDERQQLVPLIGRLFGTADLREDETERRVLSVRLAVWCAHQVLPLVRARDRAVAEAAIVAAGVWADNPTEENANAAANAANAAAYNAANSAAYNAANAATYAANAAAYAAYAAAYAANAANAAAYAYAYDLVGLLTELLDEYDRLTGRTTIQPVDLPALESLRVAATA